MFYLLFLPCYVGVVLLVWSLGGPFGYILYIFWIWLVQFVSWSLLSLSTFTSEFEEKHLFQVTFPNRPYQELCSVCVSENSTTKHRSLLTLDNLCFVWFLHRKSHKSLLLTWPYVFPCGNFEGPLCTLCTLVSQNNQWCRWVQQR